MFAQAGCCVHSAWRMPLTVSPLPGKQCLAPAANVVQVHNHGRHTLALLPALSIIVWVHVRVVLVTRLVFDHVELLQVLTGVHNSRWAVNQGAMLYCWQAG